MNKTDNLPTGSREDNEYTAPTEQQDEHTDNGLGGETVAGSGSVHPDDDYRIAAEHANVFIARYFHDKALLRLNPETAAELGISRCEIRNFPQDAFNAGEIAPESADECLELAAKIRAGEPEGSSMLRCYNRRVGHFVWYMVNFTSVFGRDGEVKYTVITLRNHTEQRNRDLAYEQYQEYLARLDNGRTAAYEHNLVSDICQMSRGTLFDGAVSEGVLDFNSRVLLWGKRVVLPEYSVRCIDFLSKERLIAAYRDGNRTQQLEYRARIGGSERWIRLSVNLTGSKDGEEIKAFMLHEDVTEAKLSEMTLREQSERDPLTGVFNRKAFIEHFGRLIKRAPDSMNAVIMIDIDFFKNVNDTLGHIVGDRVIQEIAERLRGALRADDIIGRIGGDEFIVCLMGVQSESVIKRRADRLCRIMQEQLSVGISISCSLGSAIYPIDGNDFESLYNCADIALYAAKKGGRNRNVMYSETTGRETQSQRFATPIERAYENAHEKTGAVKLYDKDSYADDSIGARFSHAVECLDIILFVYNVDTKETIASKKYSRFVISSQHYLSPDSEQFMVGVHPHDRDMFSRRLMSIMAHGGNSSDMSVRLLLETGEYEWNNMYLMSAADESGRVIEIIGIIKSADGNKSQASVQLQTLQQHMDEVYMLIEMSEQMRTIFVSENYKRLPGFIEGLCENPEETCDDSTCADDALVETVIKNASRTGELTETIYHMERNGKTYWRQMRAVRIPYALSDAPVLMVILRDITERKNTIQQLANESERLDFLLDVSGMYIISMQFKDRKTYMGRTCCSVELSPSIATALGLDSAHMDNFPEAMIENGIVNAESAQALREITEKVMSHRGMQACAGVPAPQYSRVLRIRSLSEEPNSDSMYYTPVRLTFRLLPGDNGTYTQACGIIEHVETIQRSRMLYEQEFRYRELIDDDMIYYSQVNLSQGTVVELWARDFSQEQCASVYTIEQLNSLLVPRFPMPEDQARFIDQQSVERFMDSLGKAMSWSVREYRYADPKGQIQWVAVEMHTIINPYNGDIYCFVYARDVDRTHKLMVALPQRPEICENCRLYEGESIKGMVKSLARTASKDARIGMIALRIDRFAEFKRRMSSHDFNEMMLTISRKLRCIYKGSNIAAHYNEDTFTVIMSEDVTDDTVKAATEQMMTVLRDPSMFINSYERQIVYHCGVCIMKAQSADFDSLYNGCMNNMHYASAAQKNDFEAIPSRLAMTASEGAERRTVDDAVSDMYVQTVSSTDKDLFRMCAERLAVAGEVEDSIAGVLELVGQFYEATRAYAIELSPDGSSFVNVGQWSADHSVPELAQGKTVALSCFPGLTMACEQCKPYIIADASSLKRNGFDAEYELLHSQGINSSYNVPLISGGCAIGFLGVDNPGVQNVDIGAMSAVAFFIVSEMEKRRAVERQKYLITHDALTGLYNRNGYLRLVHTVPPETMTSLGLAVVDINKLDSINAELGIDFGDILLTHAASTLLDGFSREEVFRYGGGTFYVVCRDITEESFIHRIETAMDKLDCEYIGNFSAGYLWVDTVISIDHHLEQAKELLAAAKLELSTKESTAKTQRARRQEELLAAIENGYFVVYLQPKFNSFTGTLIGAEALARMMHPEKGKIKPNRFVPILEAHGNIRFLDLHIFTSVCKMMREWMDRGVEMFPVSLNFSRATLLEPGIVGTITTIADEHGIPHNLLEIELTETLGDMERETIARIGGSIIDAGFRLSLDDFGAKYSNLSVLSSVRFSALKLDKSLVDSIMSNKMTRSVLDRVISLCAEYGIECIAEGVESVEQQKQLNALGCAHIQGFLYNKPMPAEDFAKKYL